MRRSMVFALIAGFLTLLVGADVAHAQRGRGWGNGGARWYVSTPYFSYGSGGGYYGNSGFYGGNFGGYQPYYGYRSYYGPQYTSGWQSGFYSSPLNNSYWNTPNYGGYYSSTPIYSGGYYSSAPVYSGIYGNSEYPAYSSNAIQQASFVTQSSSQVPIRIVVPTPDAKVWIEGTATHQGGLERTFVSPPLDQNQNYTYTIKASWMENGQEVQREKKVGVKVGQEVVVNFTTPSANETAQIR